MATRRLNQRLRDIIEARDRPRHQPTGHMNISHGRESFLFENDHRDHFAAARPCGAHAGGPGDLDDNRGPRENDNRAPRENDNRVAHATSAPAKKIFGDDGECVVCMDANRDSVFTPCHHYACCAGCASRCKECPMCRAAVVGVLKRSEVE